MQITPSKVSLALQGGEKIDIFESLGDFNNYVATDMTYELNDLSGSSMDGESKILIGDDWLAACTADGTYLWCTNYETGSIDTNGNLQTGYRR